MFVVVYIIWVCVIVSAVCVYNWIETKLALCCVLWGYAALTLAGQDNK